LLLPLLLPRYRLLQPLQLVQLACQQLLLSRGCIHLINTF
jgi:hypothetical protein